MAGVDLKFADPSNRQMMPLIPMEWKENKLESDHVIHIARTTHQLALLH